MLNRNVGEYCEDTGTPHAWEMHSEEGCFVIDCKCGAKAAEFLGDWALNLSHIPVNIRIPRLSECEDTPWVDASLRL